MIVRNRFGKFDAPVCAGEVYRIIGYHTGDFIGECERVDRDVARFCVLDSLRPAPRVSSKCPYPACVLREFHGGEHELASIRVGAVVEVSWRFATFVDAARLELAS